MTEIKTILNLKKKMIIPNYEILKKMINNNEIINYNYQFDKGNVIKKKYCAYNKNLVLVYAISYCIKEKIKKIKIYGLSKNNENSFIINNLKKYIKKNKIKSHIVLN